jgi:hypothetical protein
MSRYEPGKNSASSSFRNYFSRDISRKKRLVPKDWDNKKISYRDITRRYPTDLTGDVWIS